MMCRATQDRWIMVESSDKMWSTREGTGKSLHHSCLENPMNSMSCMSFLYTLEINPLLVISFANIYFFPFYRLSFWFVGSFLYCEKPFKFN